MFGKRSGGAPAAPRKPIAADRRRGAGQAGRRRKARRSAEGRLRRRRRRADDAHRGRIEPQRKHSEEYYDVKTTVFNALIDTIDLTQLAKLEAAAAREEIRDIVSEIITLKNVVMSIAEQEELLEDICNDVLGYGPLEPLLARDDIADIMVNGAGVDLHRSRRQGAEDQRPLCRQRAADEHLPAHRQPGRPPRRRKLADLRRPSSRRLARQRHRAAARHRRRRLTIRKFKKDRLKLEQLVKFGSITPAAKTILEVIGRVRCNVIVSGGTGSGKTTLLNCISGTIDTDERIITCEDSAELQLQQPHVVRLETRPPNLEGEGQITMRDLVKNCLRMRPERIIVGEVRGPEAFDLLQAMNTGHDGSMGTLHANSPREAISRMESMIMMGGFALPTKTIREMITGSVDVIVQASRLRDGSRKITHITEVVGMEGDVVTLQNIIVFDILGEDANGKIVGRHRSTGIARPRFWERAEYYGETGRLAEALASAEVSDVNGNPLGE